MSSGYPPFDQYNDQFRLLIREVEERFHNGEDVAELLAQCDDLLPQMLVEARGSPSPSLKQELKDIYQACQMQLDSYNTLSKQKELFSPVSNKSSQSTSTQQERLEATQNLASKQNATLENALRSVRETEEIAAEVSQELGRNRKTLENANDNVGKTKGMVQDANVHLKSMMRKWF